MIFFDGTYRLQRGKKSSKSSEKTRSGAWRLRLINLSISQPDVTHLKPIIVVATPTDGAIFFSTCAESLGRRICRDFNLNLKETLWIESYPHRTNRLHVAVFPLRSYPGTETHDSILWRPIRPNELNVIKFFITEIHEQGFGSG